ncbi:hypothetical protein V8F33_005913 [Rhypophila sp. PSN 637]
MTPLAFLGAQSLPILLLLLSLILPLKTDMVFIRALFHSPALLGLAKNGFTIRLFHYLQSLRIVGSDVSRSIAKLILGHQA